MVAMLKALRTRRARSSMFALLLGSSLIASLAVAHVASAQPQSATTDQNVGISKFTFSPAEQWLLAGRSIIWTNADPVDHDVAATDGSWDSGTISPGATFSFAFATPGDYTYVDTLYAGMTGVIHVVANASQLPLAPLAKVTRIADEVPPDERDKGALQVATDATYAPNEFVDPQDGQVKGWDVDLANAVGTVLGLPLVINNADFNSIIPNLGTRYDLSFSSFTPTEEREKTVDFVTYYQAGESWLVRTGGPQINSATDLCGRTVAVETGTTEESDAWGFMGKKPDGTPIEGDKDNCAAAGKPAITVHSFVKQTEANADLLGGRADVGWADQPVADYQVQLLTGQLQISGQACSVAPYGVAFPKGSGMLESVQDAIKYLIDNGYYAQILKKWNVSDGAIASSKVLINNNDTVGASCVPSY
jgi:polar amino acid transport system substrate-binding protein